VSWLWLSVCLLRLFSVTIIFILFEDSNNRSSSSWVPLPLVCLILGGNIFSLNGRIGSIDYIGSASLILGSTITVKGDVRTGLIYSARPQSSANFATIVDFSPNSLYPFYFFNLPLCSFLLSRLIHFVFVYIFYHLFIIILKHS
jgi:hypothetical protein